MAKEKNTPVEELTAEELKIANDKLVEENAVNAAAAKELSSENESLKATVEELEAKLAQFEKKNVVSTSANYKSGNGKVYRFINKVRSFSVLGIGAINPTEAVENEELMEKLIKLEYAGLEIVND